MTIQDKNIGWRAKRLWIGAKQFQGLDNNASADISLSQGTPTVEPASGTIEMSTIPMTTADEVGHIMPIPWDLDRSGKVAARVYFIHASTDASDAPVFKVTSLFYAKQAQTVEAFANADKSTSITHPGTSATDDSLEVTDWTDLSWDSYITATDIMVALGVELDALGSAGADECEFLGIELMYDVDATDVARRRKTEHEIQRNPV